MELKYLLDLKIIRSNFIGRYNYKKMDNLYIK